MIIETRMVAGAMDIVLYVFVRRQGHGPEDAEDLVQEFFARLFRKHYLDAVEPQRGRFRTFLIMALKRFMANEWDRSRAQKRGRGQELLPLDTALAEGRYHEECSVNMEDDLDLALEGKQILIPPNSPCDGVTVAFIVDHGAPIEFLKFDRPEAEIWPHDAKFKIA